MNSVFDELYRQYHQDIYQFLFYMVRNKEHAEDLVQEVYIRVLKSYDRFEKRSSEKTWLFSIAKNVAIDFFRKQKGWKQRLLEKFDWSTQQVKDESHPIPDEIAIQNEKLKSVYECLNHCTYDQRAVIILRYFHDLSIAETAEALDWTESKVKTTQHRALGILRKQMKRLDEREVCLNEKIGME